MAFLEIGFDFAVYEEERRGLLAKVRVRKVLAGQLTVDPYSGRIVMLDEQRRVSPTSHSLPELTQEEAELLQTVGGGSFSRDDLAAHGFSSGKAQRIISSLLAKDVLVRVQGPDRRVFYSNNAPLPSPRVFQALGSAFSARARPLPSEPKMLDLVRRDQASFVRSLETLVPEAQVTKIETLYYPLYAYTIHRPDGARRTELLDGTSGEIRQTTAALV